MKKPWLDDPLFKEKLKEKHKLYSKKRKKGSLTQEEELKLTELWKEVNKIRRKLTREYFTPTIAGEDVSNVEIDAPPGAGEGVDGAEKVEDGGGVIDGTEKAEDGGGQEEVKNDLGKKG